MRSIWNWLVDDWHWPAAALFAACALLALFPLLAGAAGLPVAVVFLQLPLYMLHQWEEHAGDRFRQYVNRVIGGGREVLTPAATFWINALGVWGVDLAALYAAWLAGPAAGLAAGYLAVVNALLHLGPAIRRREYNPGLITALVLLLPGGIWCVVAAGGSAGWPAHAAGLAVAVGLHLAIVAHVVRRLAGRDSS
jgi:hypothetical protein